MAHFTSVLTWLGVLMARPAAFVVLVCYVAAWLALNPQSFDWHAVATVATWLMTLFIQRAEHRDTQAIHAKLDELLRVEGRARSELTQLDDEEPEVIEQHRSKERQLMDGNRQRTSGQGWLTSRRASRVLEWSPPTDRFGNHLEGCRGGRATCSG